MKCEDRTKYTHWIKALADYQGGRPHFSDQTPESLDVLAKLVEIHQPTMIVELGTAHGLSTRLWLDTVPETTVIHCVDASFQPLRGTATVLTVNFDRLILHETWVDSVQLENLWTEKDRVFLYIDVHSQHTHALAATLHLPERSVVLFDDVWYSEQPLDNPEIREAFIEETVKPQIDFTAPKEIWPLCWANYRTGALYGFGEVPLIAAWLLEHNLTAHWEKEAKVLWWEV